MYERSIMKLKKPASKENKIKVSKIVKHKRILTAEGKKRRLVKEKKVGKGKS